MSRHPLVTVGFVNCNRLHYLKSCVESFLEATHDYPEKDLIIVDNASVEQGTDEYLEEKKKQGFTIHQYTTRDYTNEFATALNTICSNARGQFIIPLQGDMQFVVKGRWLEEYVKFYQNNLTSVGCITLDAARKVTNASRHASLQFSPSGYSFVLNVDSMPIIGAGDVMYSRDILQMILPWKTDNLAHEGGSDSETAMLQKCRQLIVQKQLQLHSATPVVPPAVMIYTDARGTNARVRGRRRYGDYWAPSDGHKYYEMFDYETAMTMAQERSHPVMSIEELAKPIGWSAPIDEQGNWKKNPIRPELAGPGDFVELQSEYQHFVPWSQRDGAFDTCWECDENPCKCTKNIDDTELDSWLNG